MSRVQLEKKRTIQLVSELQTVLKPYICMSIASLDRMWQQVNHAIIFKLGRVRALFDEDKISIEIFCRAQVNLASHYIYKMQEA